MVLQRDAELVLREGIQESIKLKDEAEKRLEEAQAEEVRVRECTNETVEDLEYRLCVGIAEA
jgi:hypothetical protein